MGAASSRDTLPPGPTGRLQGGRMGSALRSSVLGSGGHGPATGAQAPALAGLPPKSCYLPHFIRLPAAEHRKLKATGRLRSVAPSDLRQILSPFPPTSPFCKKVARSSPQLNSAESQYVPSQGPRGQEGDPALRELGVWGGGSQTDGGGVYVCMCWGRGVS